MAFESEAVTDALATSGILGVYTFTPRDSCTSPPAVRIAQRIVPSKKEMPLSNMPSPRN